ncbi:MAG: hypothetical protein IKU88_05420 [Alistipes sp.]|nr:hypothetical protein [Alistipes sp.]
MKRYIYTLYGSIVVTMLAVIIASAHNIYNDEKASAVGQQNPVADTLVRNFSFRPDSVPVMNSVPLQGPDFNSLDTITSPASSLGKAKSAADRRAAAASMVAFEIDSLVASHAIAFYPSAMQAAPSDKMRMIYADYYYLYISPVDLEVHIPVVHTPSGYTTMLNFDSDSIANYQSRKQLSEWIITFSAATSGDNYDFQLIISTITGEAELIVASSKISMRYLGRVGHRAEIHQSKAAKFFQELGKTNPAATN